MATPVELRVGDQTYRVITSSPESEVRTIAAVVDARFRQLAPAGKHTPAQRLLLVAMALAHELEEEKGLRRERDARWREKVQGLVTRVDGLLELLPGEPDPRQPEPARLQPIGGG